MKTSDFTKKCQVALDALNEVLKELGEDDENVETLIFAQNILHSMAIPEGPKIGRSIMKCLIIEDEDRANSLSFDDERKNYFIQCTRLLFKTMDEMGITRMNKEVYNEIRAYVYFNEDLIKTGYESDDAKKSLFRVQIEDIMIAHPEYFEMGNSESEIECDESCRGTEKVIKKKTMDGHITDIAIIRPENCLYKDWL